MNCVAFCDPTWPGYDAFACEVKRPRTTCGNRPPIANLKRKSPVSAAAAPGFPLPRDVLPRRLLELDALARPHTKRFVARRFWRIHANIDSASIGRVLEADDRWAQVEARRARVR